MTDSPKENLTQDAVIEDTTIKEGTIKFDEKITVRNLAPWTVGWNKIESNGEVNINPFGAVRITRAEFISDFENGNKLICGIDGNGKHATVATDDKATREYLEITNPIITKDITREIFEIKGIKNFENKIADTYVTRAEKLLLIEHIKQCNFNDYNKIRYCENNCGMTVK